LVKKCPRLHINSGSLVKKCPRLHINSGSLVKKCPRLHINSGSLVKKCPRLHINSGSLVKKCPRLHINLGVFLGIRISFWIIKENRFVKRCGTEPIDGISSNIILQIIFSEQT